MMIANRIEQRGGKVFILAHYSVAGLVVGGTLLDAHTYAGWHMYRHDASPVALLIIGFFIILTL